MSDSYDPPEDIENGYFSLKRQTQFGKILCHYLGCFQQKSNQSPHNDEYPLLYDYDQCKNIERVTSPDIAQDVMKLLTQACVQIVQDKQPISDDLLVLCYDYSRVFQFEEARLLEIALAQAIDQCLSEDVDSRSSEWFRQYIQNSNILLLSSVLRKGKGIAAYTYKSAESKETSIVSNTKQQNAILHEFNTNMKPHVENKLLYAYFVEQAKDKTKQQQQHIHHKCDQLQELKNSFWRKILEFDYKMNDKNDSMLRQDGISDIQIIQQRFPNVRSVLPDLNGKTLDLRGEYEGKSGLFLGSNQDQYLAKCIVVAHSLNDKFHATMKTIVGRYKFKAVYREATVKTKERYGVYVFCQYFVNVNR